MQALRAVPLFLSLLLASALAQPGADTDAEGRAALLANTEATVMEALAAGDTGRALLIVNTAISDGLPLAQGHLLRSSVYAARQDQESEERELQAAISRDATLLDGYLRLGAIKESRNLWLDAADVYSRLVQNCPQAVAGYVRLARIMRQHGRDKTAIEVLLQGRTVAPNDAEILAALGGAYEHVGRLPEALASYRDAARLATDKGVRRKVLADAARLSLALGEYAGAVSYFREALAAGVPITADSYPLIARAGDGAVWGQLAPVWGGFESYLAGDAAAPEREQIYVALTRALAEARDTTGFVDTLDAPAGERARHALRKLQNSLVCEALINAVLFLDTGDEALATDARLRYEDAAAQRKALEPADTGRAGG